MGAQLGQMLSSGQGLSAGGSQLPMPANVGQSYGQPATTPQPGTPGFLNQFNQSNGQPQGDPNSEVSPMMIQMLSQYGQSLPGGQSSMGNGLPQGTQYPGSVTPQQGVGSPTGAPQQPTNPMQYAQPQWGNNPMDNQLRQQFATWARNRVGGMNPIPSGKKSIPSGQLPVTGEY